MKMREKRLLQLIPSAASVDPLSALSSTTKSSDSKQHSNQKQSPAAKRSAAAAAASANGSSLSSTYQQTPTIDYHKLKAFFCKVLCFTKTVNSLSIHINGVPTFSCTKSVRFTLVFPGPRARRQLQVLTSSCSVVFDYTHRNQNRPNVAWIEIFDQKKRSLPSQNYQNPHNNSVSTNAIFNPSSPHCLAVVAVVAVVVLRLRNLETLNLQLHRLPVSTVC